VSGVEREDAQQLVFGGGEGEGLSGQCHLAGLVVDRELVESERLGWGPAAEGRADPRDQFGRGEWFHDVVVGSGFQCACDGLVAAVA